MWGEVLIELFFFFFKIIQGFKYSLNTTNNENVFWNISCILQLLQSPSLLLRTTELFPWAKSIRIGKINRLYSFPLGCIRSCMVNYFFWMLKIAVPHLLCCGEWYKITPLTVWDIPVGFMGFWRLQESAQLEAVFRIQVSYWNESHTSTFIFKT